MDSNKSKAGRAPAERDRGWPAWARGLATLAIIFHVLAVLAGAFGARPSSRLQDEVARFFGLYHQLLDQGDGYHYYSTAFPPTPVVTATLSFADGRPDKVVRLPDRGLRPRLMVQRQLALAHNLTEDYEAAKGEGSKGHWAGAYAAHLGRSNPGCKSVSLEVNRHFVPPLGRVQHLLEAGRGAVDLDADEFFGEPEHIGVFPCVP